MASMRELKGRIKSVHSSQKITGAMKMISSARLRKAEAALFQSLPYRKQLQHLYAHMMTTDCKYGSVLSQARPVRQVAVVIFASDDGLCGAYNITLYKKLLETLHAYWQEGAKSISVYPIGKKIMNEVNKLSDVRMVDTSHLFSPKEASQTAAGLSDELIRKFITEEVDRVDIIYAHYKSVSVQTLVQRQFLPLLKPEVAAEDTGTARWYIYEPDCQTIFDTLYPLMLNAIMYEGLLENQASEQAARIIAMQMANDNAKELLDDLQLEYNKLRQQGITSELLDIAGGTVK